MTDRNRPSPSHAVEDEAPGLLGDVLDSFKTDEGPADELGVIEGIGGRPRLMWNSVTDTGGTSAPTDGGSADPASFRFDLGGALAKLVGDDDDDAPTPPPSTPSAPTEPASAAPASVTPAPVAPTPVAPAPASVAPAPAPVAPAPVASAPEPGAPVPPVSPRPEPALHELVAHRPIERNVFGDQTPPVQTPPVQTTPAHAEAPAPAAPVPSNPRIPPMSDRPLFSDHAEPESAPAPSHLADHLNSMPADYPRRVPGANLESQLRRDPAPIDLPEIHDATPVDDPPQPVVSVFGDVALDPSPTLPTPPMVGGAGAPVVSESMAPNLGGSGIPTLPASNPAAPAPVASSMSAAPSTNDITALRSAQLRGSQKQQRGRMFGRSLLAFVVIGGILAGALVFGRSLIFTTQWDAQLTPVVNEIQQERGADFDHAVALVPLPSAEFGDRLRAATIGDAWLEQVPQWRALGLMTGAVTAESVGISLAETTTAMYDAASDTVYQIEGAEPTRTRRDLRLALEAAYDQQTTSVATDAEAATDAVDSSAPAPTVIGFTGISSSASIATRAVDLVLASGGPAPERHAANESLPMPIAYEFAAIEILGEPILAAVGADPTTMRPGGTHPDAIAEILDDNPQSTTSDILRPGDVSLANPTALGNDDWSLVWGARLPEQTVARLVQQVTADSYRPIDRGGNVCFAAVFQTSSVGDGGAVFAAMLTWAASAPVASQATATSLGPTRVQLEACDPGAGAGAQANAGVVDALIDRQQARLTN